MKPFNIELYARSAESALREIAIATAAEADTLRDMARTRLSQLKQRYRHNGYINILPGQRAAQGADEND